MLKDKLSGIAILEEQVEKLQDLANKFSAITGHSIDEIEDGIVYLVTKRKVDKCNKCGSNMFAHETECSWCNNNHRYIKVDDPSICLCGKEIEL